MDNQAKALNRMINRLYRQLGKDLYDDLKKDQVNIRHYRNKSKHIDQVIQELHDLVMRVDKDEDEGEKVILAPEMDNEGLFHYKFCPSCQAGNNPEATHCIRCEAPLE